MVSGRFCLALSQPAGLGGGGGRGRGWRVGDSAIFNLNFEQTPVLGDPGADTSGAKTKSKQAGKKETSTSEIYPGKKLICVVD